MFDDHLGITCVDTWLLACYFGLVTIDVSKHYSDQVYEGNIPVKSFAGALSQQLISMGNDLNSREKLFLNILYQWFNQLPVLLHPESLKRLRC